MASERALEIARAIRKEYEVGKSSKFCDEADFDIASEEDLATMIDAALRKYESSPSWMRQRLEAIQARMDRGRERRQASQFPVITDDVSLFRRTDNQKVSILHCDCGETFTWAGVDPSLDDWAAKHKPHLTLAKPVSPTAKTARFDRPAVAPPCSCAAAPNEHIHTPGGIMNYRAEQ